jgi:hypothetical protein
MNILNELFGDPLKQAQQAKEEKQIRQPRRGLLRFVVSLILAAGAAFAWSCAADCLFGGLIGAYPTTAFLPAATWSFVSAGLILAAYALARWSRWLALPYVVFGAIAVLGGVISAHPLDFLVAGAMFLNAIFVWKASRHTPTTKVFSADAAATSTPQLKAEAGARKSSEVEELQESRADVFGLYPIDRHIQTQLLRACQAIFNRANPAQVRDLTYLIYALKRLPSTTPSVCGGVTLASRNGESSSLRGFELNGEEFILTTGESVDSGCGMDFGSRHELEVGTSAMRDIYGGDDFTEWLNMFCEQATDDSTEIEIYCDVAESVDLSKHKVGLPWEENPLLDEA